MHAAAADPELEHREQEDRGEEDIGDGGAVTGGEELERLLPQVVDDYRRRHQRPAARGDVDLVEYLQGVDRGPHHEQEGRRSEEWPDDPPEGDEPACTVDRRRLEKLARYPLQRSEIDDRVESDPAPGRHRDHGVERLVRVLEEAI